MNAEYPIPESAEVKAEREARCYGEGWETGHAKTHDEEGQDTMGVLIIAMACLVIWLSVALTLWVF